LTSILKNIIKNHSTTITIKNHSTTIKNTKEEGEKMQLSQKDYFLLHGPILIYNSKGKDLQGDTL
jgi:hypothetical protein